MTGLPEAVVVFGASGFVGRSIVDALSTRVPLLYGVTNRTARVPGCSRTVRMAALDDLPALPADTAVVNVAARRYVASTFQADQSEILHHNAHLATAVYHFCVTRGIREVRMASSVAVYPADWDPLDDDRPLDLNAWPHEGEAAYAWSKRWAEICGEIHRRRSGIHTLSFRLTNPYGPHDSTDPAAAHVAAAFVMKALAPTREFEIAGNPDAERDFVYVSDVAEVFLASLSCRGLHDAFNLAQGRTTSIRRLAEAALAAAGGDKPIRVVGSAAAGVSVRRATAKRLQRAFRLPRFRTLEEGLAATVSWYRDALGH